MSEPITPGRLSIVSAYEASGDDLHAIFGTAVTCFVVRKACGAAA